MKRKLAENDVRLALSVLREKVRRPGRLQTCSGCGLRYPEEEVQRDYSEDGRRIGWICDGCY